VLADLAAPDASRWTAGDRVSSRHLGLIMMALERTVETFGDLAERSRILLAEQAAFLDSSLWDGSGGFREAWNADLGVTADADSERTTRRPRRTPRRRPTAGGSASGIDRRSSRSMRDSGPDAEIYVGRLDCLLA
jgi:hypothetical protein